MDNEPEKYREESRQIASEWYKKIFVNMMCLIVKNY